MKSFMRVFFMLAYAVIAYLALWRGIDGAQNILLAYVWLIIVLGVVGLAGFVIAADSINYDPPPRFWFYAGLIISTVVGASSIWHGWIVTGIALLFVTLSSSILDKVMTEKEI